MATAQGGSAKYTAGTVDQALEQIRLNRRTHQSRANSSFMITRLGSTFPVEEAQAPFVVRPETKNRLPIYFGSSVGRANDFKHLHQALMLGLGST
ncbi:hypothetical protein PGTUg99_006259 [Puccinia graminis f. sp. tritici]|nr:hypothetical protein PGTUg99_006259 [Puccinia graminis f. sp. tritici]